ncbi:MAG: pilus assembly protein PilM [Phycisphaerales bacterium]|nr:pilus assembly protein PilM [Phycisphaerales bacterium]
MGLVGIDFSGDCVRMLQMRYKNGVWSVNAAAARTCDLQDDLQDLPRLTEWIRGAMSAAGFTAKRCVVVLPREHIKVQSVRLPQMAESDTRQAVRWEASQRFGIDPDAMEVDYLATGAQLQGQDVRQELLLIASESERILPLLRAIAESGLRPIAAETSFTAVARALSLRLRREADQDTVRAVVEMGRTGTTIMVLRGDQIAFCKPLTFGGVQFDVAASEHLGIDLVAAREIRTARIASAASKNTTGPIDDAETDRAVYESIRPFIEQLTKEITLSLRYYGVTFRGHAPKFIILAGPEAQEPHLARMLEHSCKLPVKTDDENESLTNLLPQIHSLLNRMPGSIHAWAATIGACTRELPKRARSENSERAAA